MQEASDYHHVIIVFRLWIRLICSAMISSFAIYVMRSSTRWLKTQGPLKFSPFEFKQTLHPTSTHLPKCLFF